MTVDDFRPHEGEPVADYIRRMRACGVKMPAAKMIKTKEQIDGCREAGRINSLVLDAVEREIRVGMTTEDIDEIVAFETKRLGGTAACLGFEGYPKSVCTSLNDVICHGIPSVKDVIREGDILNVDCTTIYNGYFGDASRMFTFGEITPSARRLVEVTKESVDLTAAAIKPYETHLGDIGHIISSHARKNGFTVVREIGGHGVGLEMHEDPYVCHTGIAGSGILLIPGMIFTVEPMVCEGKARFFVDEDDGWTVYTEDGKLTAQVEYELLVTESGVEILSK